MAGTVHGSFRDRLLTPGGAAAVTHPLALLGAGAAAGTLLAVGGPVILALGGGMAAYAAVAASKIPKAPPRPDRVDPRSLGQPWGQFVTEAYDAEQRFAVAVEASDAFSERLDGMRSRMALAVDELCRVATSGDRLSQALRHLPDAGPLRAEQQQAAAGGHAERAASLGGQAETVERLQAIERDTIERLRLFDARLDESVARAVALPIEAGASGGVASLADDLDEVVVGLRSLSAAVAEVQQV